MSKFTLSIVYVYRDSSNPGLRWTIYWLRSKSYIELGIRQNCRTIALPCFRRTRVVPIDLWYHKGVWLGKTRLDVDVIQQCRGRFSSAVELNSLGIQINAPILSSLFRHVFPAFPFLHPLFFFHISFLLALLTPMNFITLRVSAWERICAHVAAFMHATYNSWSVSSMHSCTTYGAALFAAATEGYRPRSLERRVFRGTVEEKSIIETDRMYTEYIPIGSNCRSNSGKMELKFILNVTQCGSLWCTYYNREFNIICFVQTCAIKTLLPIPISTFFFHIIWFIILLFLVFIFFLFSFT